MTRKTEIPLFTKVDTVDNTGIIQTARMTNTTRSTVRSGRFTKHHIQQNVSDDLLYLVTNDVNDLNFEPYELRKVEIVCGFYFPGQVAVWMMNLQADCTKTPILQFTVRLPSFP